MVIKYITAGGPRGFITPFFKEEKEAEAAAAGYTVAVLTRALFRPAATGRSRLVAVGETTRLRRKGAACDL